MSVSVIHHTFQAKLEVESLAQLIYSPGIGFCYDVWCMMCEGERENVELTEIVDVGLKATLMLIISPLEIPP